MAIDQQLDLVFDIRCFGSVTYAIYVNGKQLSGDRTTVGLNEPAEIEIKKSGSGLLDIAGIHVAGRTIMPLYLSHAEPPTNRLEDHDTWKMSIAPNAFVWLHHTSGQGWIA
jgi:hypothetical protein